MRAILLLFLNYNQRLGKDVCVVFDGYQSGPSTKDHEHVRRTGKAGAVAPTRHVTADMKQIRQQESFLANVENKTAFINLLMTVFQKAGIKVRQAPGDADTEIVSVALQLAREGSSTVAVLAEDIDILALLLYHRQPTMQEILFFSEAKRGRGGKLTGGKQIRISALQKILSDDGCKTILSVHASGGCDTTSAIFGHGKGAIRSRIAQEKKLQQHCLALQSQSASVHEVRNAGIRLMIGLYGGSDTDSLTSLHYM